MIGMIDDHLLVKMNWSYHVQKNSNVPAPRPYVNCFKKKCDDKVGLYGNEPSPQISINKGSSIHTIDQILSPSTINNHFLDSYFT